MAGQLMEINIDVPFLSIMPPFRGTSIYDMLEKEQRIIPKRGWNFYNGYNVVFRPKKMSPAELLEAHRELWKKSFSFAYSIKRIIQA